jgi:hypothetical protein
MDGESENFLVTTNGLSGFDVTRKVLSFGYFSLHQQRKVTRRKAKALDLECGFQKDDRHVTNALQHQSEGQRLSPAGEVLSFAGPKESTQRKRPSS